MARGLPSWALAKARERKARNPFAYAWSLVKRRGKSGSKPSRSSNPKGGKKTMARRRRWRRFRRRARKMTIPIAPIAGLAAGMVQPVDYAIKGDYYQAGRYLVANYTGFDISDMTWVPSNLYRGLLPLVIGFGVHQVVGNWLGVNRALANAKVPFIRI